MDRNIKEKIDNLKPQFHYKWLKILPAEETSYTIFWTDLTIPEGVLEAFICWTHRNRYIECKFMDTFSRLSQIENVKGYIVLWYEFRGNRLIFSPIKRCVKTLEQLCLIKWGKGTTGRRIFQKMSNTSNSNIVSNCFQDQWKGAKCSKFWAQLYSSVMRACSKTIPQKKESLIIRTCI